MVKKVYGKKMVKKIAILGSTGSIGVNTLNLVSRYKDSYQVMALAAGSNLDLLSHQVREFRPQIVSIREASQCQILKEKIKSVNCEIVAGEEGLRQVATHPGVELVVSAISGASGLVPTYQAILAGKDIALANKETMVMAGQIMVEKARGKGVRILPVDSEHSAIFQCLSGRSQNEVKNLWLTASGGPFFFSPREKFPYLTYQKALEHPTWNMGEKVSLDSATLMNKALEVIEAKWFFNMSLDQIKVIVHPESIVHSMVEFCDGNFLALLSLPDMRLPILYALSYPTRSCLDLSPLDLTKLRSLSFYPPDLEKFPCLALGYQAAGSGETFPAVFNAANEIALEAFKKGRISFPDIPRIIEKTLTCHQPIPLCEIEDALWADHWAREHTCQIIGRLS